MTARPALLELSRISEALGDYDAPPPPATLGERLRARRVELGLTQAQLAARVAAYGGAVESWRSQICRLEAGGDVRVTTLQAIVAALGCRLVLRRGGR